MISRAQASALLAAAVIVAIAASPDEAQKWVVKSTEDYKGHPVWHGADLVECTNAVGDEPGLTMLVRYPQWRQIKLGDACPSGDIVWTEGDQ